MIADDPKDKVGGKFLVHTMQVLPNMYCKAMETQKILPVNGETPTVHLFKCVADNILEVCIAKYWSNFGDVTLNFKVKFHGIATKNECKSELAGAFYIMGHFEE
jgi:tripeptidyl-peptidase II